MTEKDLSSKIAEKLFRQELSPAAVSYLLRTYQDEIRDICRFYNSNPGMKEEELMQMVSKEIGTSL